MNRSDGLVSDFPMNKFQNEEKQVILTIHKIIGVNNTTLSFHAKNDIVILRVHNLKQIDYTTLRKVMVCSDKVKNIVVNLGGNSNTLSIYIANGKTKPGKKYVLINKHKRKLMKLNNTKLTKCANNFLNKRHYKEEDKRLLREIITKILKWGKGGKAIEMDFQMEGDLYNFVLKKLNSITYFELNDLVQLGDWIQNIRISFKQKNESLIHFTAIRGINYINNNYNNNNIVGEKRKLLH